MAQCLSASVTFALIEILGIIYNKTNIFFLESATGIKGVALYGATWNDRGPDLNIGVGATSGLGDISPSWPQFGGLIWDRVDAHGAQQRQMARYPGFSYNVSS